MFLFKDDSSVEATRKHLFQLDEINKDILYAIIQWCECNKEGPVIDWTNPREYPTNIDNWIDDHFSLAPYEKIMEFLVVSKTLKLPGLAFRLYQQLFINFNNLLETMKTQNKTLIFPVEHLLQEASSFKLKIVNSSRVYSYTDPFSYETFETTYKPFLSAFI